MRILVTNDDGVQVRGIHALGRARERLGEVTIVAPHLEASAIGHALTLRRPLRFERSTPRVYEVDGTPTDCVNIAIAKILGAQPGPHRVRHQQGLQPRRRRDVFGDRRGRDGRRAAGYPEYRRLARAQAPRSTSARRGRRGARGRSRAPRGLPPRTFININVPPGRPKGFRLTVQARRNHVTVVDERVDPRGKAVLLDRGRAERLGAARPVRLSGGQ